MEFTGSNCGGGECLGAGVMVVVVVGHSKSRGKAAHHYASSSNLHLSINEESKANFCFGSYPNY